MNISRISPYNPTYANKFNFKGTDKDNQPKLNSDKTKLIYAGIGLGVGAALAAVVLAKKPQKATTNIDTKKFLTTDTPSQKPKVEIETDPQATSTVTSAELNKLKGKLKQYDGKTLTEISEKLFNEVVEAIVPKEIPLLKPVLKDIYKTSKDCNKKYLVYLEDIDISSEILTKASKDPKSQIYKLYNNKDGIAGKKITDLTFKDCINFFFDFEDLKKYLTSDKTVEFVAQFTKDKQVAKSRIYNFIFEIERGKDFPNTIQKDENLKRLMKTLPHAKIDEPMYKWYGKTMVALEDENNWKKFLMAQNQ